MKKVKVSKYKDLNFEEKNILCVTHTERECDFSSCNIDFFKNYYSATRLPPDIPFEHLEHSNKSYPYSGRVTFWSVDDEAKLTLLAVAHPNNKPQHATLYDKKIWILCHNELLICDIDTFDVIDIIRDPWLAGAHTIFFNEDGNAVISCSGSDAVLIIDSQSYKTIDYFRLPEEIYGKNYDLTRNHSVFEHYIPNIIQLGHINCAFPFKKSIYVSTLIQGAIGVFYSNKEYYELKRGIIGCHGVRKNSNSELYYCDSCNGMLVIETTRGLLRIRTPSRWLHDAVELFDNKYALALADLNCITIIDIKTQSVVLDIPCSQFGEGVQFFSYCPAENNRS